MLTIRLNVSSPPSICRAIVCTAAGQPLAVQTIPTPDVFPGSVIVRVLACSVEPATAHIQEGGIPGLTLPTPIVPGAREIGRVASIGPDTITLQIGWLAMPEPFYPWPR
jgi:D-arabinose 1-dehydrogenase-like Zn-dependent alcohol dehydrogenase